MGNANLKLSCTNLRLAQEYCKYLFSSHCVGPRNPFTSPDAMEKLRKDPRTAELMNDPAFLDNLRSMQTSVSTE